MHKEVDEGHGCGLNSSVSRLLSFSLTFLKRYCLHLLSLLSSQSPPPDQDSKVLRCYIDHPLK